MNDAAPEAPSSSSSSSSSEPVIGGTCPTCGGTGDLGGEVNGSPLGCDFTSPVEPGTPLCNGTGIWNGERKGGPRVPYEL